VLHWRCPNCFWTTCCTYTAWQSATQRYSYSSLHSGGMPALWHYEVCGFVCNYSASSSTGAD